MPPTHHPNTPKLQSNLADLTPPIPPRVSFSPEELLPSPNMTASHGDESRLFFCTNLTRKEALKFRGSSEEKYFQGLTTARPARRQGDLTRQPAAGFGQLQAVLAVQASCGHKPRARHRAVQAELEQIYLPRRRWHTHNFLHANGLFGGIGLFWKSL